MCQPITRVPGRNTQYNETITDPKWLQVPKTEVVIVWRYAESFAKSLYLCFIFRNCVTQFTPDNLNYNQKHQQLIKNTRQIKRPATTKCFI